MSKLKITILYIVCCLLCLLISYFYFVPSLKVEMQQTIDFFGFNPYPPVISNPIICSGILGLNISMMVLVVTRCILHKKLPSNQSELLGIFPISIFIIFLLLGNLVGNFLGEEIIAFAKFMIFLLCLSVLVCAIDFGYLFIKTISDNANCKLQWLQFFSLIHGITMAVPCLYSVISLYYIPL